MLARRFLATVLLVVCGVASTGVIGRHGDAAVSVRRAPTIVASGSSSVWTVDAATPGRVNLPADPLGPMLPIVGSGSVARAPFSVRGNVMADRDGQPFVVHGVDRPSLEWDCTGQAISGAPGIESADFQQMARWGANTVRLPLNQDFWLSSLGLPVNAKWACPTYQQAVRLTVQNAEAAGLIPILDLHWSDEGDMSTANVGQKCMADQNSLLFWQSVAGQYAADSAVMFELYNEPMYIPWSVWRSGGLTTCQKDGVTYQAVGMQTLVDAIRRQGANNVVLAGGLKEAYDLESVPAYPLSGTNIAYSTHPYEGYVGDSPSGWDTAFGFLSKSAPVVATEFGNNVNCGGTDSYTTDILDYMNKHGIGFTQWLWYPNDCLSLVDANGNCVKNGCLLQSELQGLASGAIPFTVPQYQALPNVAAGGSTVHDTFENSVLGWKGAWNSSELAIGLGQPAHTGSSGLKVQVVSTGKNAALEQWSGLDGLGPSSVVTYWIYAPSGFSDTVTPFARDGAYTPHFWDTVYLQPGWNQLNWQVPPMTGLLSVGLEIEASDSWTGSLVLDDIAW